MEVNIKQHTIHYERYGSGPELLFCLHGYGERGQDFEALANHLGHRFTIICPDLPLHGKTNWNDHVFELTDLRNCLSELAKKERFKTQQFSLAGYSMGGRLAMEYAEHFPEQLRQLILIAPDGLKINFWYWLTTQTKAGNRLFFKTMQHPEWLFFGMKWARKFRLLNESIFKFSHRYLDDPQQRNELYKRWTLFRNFKPNLQKLGYNLNKSPLPTLLIFGKFDRIIPPKLGQRLKAGNAGSNSIIVLEAGHRLLKPQFASTIAEYINTMRKR
ncbi:alpha/beta fold hydrolase [Flavihumibacter profundi]|uniref:alpha/beta fold hydrolase n=1 Tax=Flavihumibacter profundi TaxID=2716883 RepID=UPI001CC49DF8|nr:alpha/beta hydrolase [Flavihumibacter profundi]MBZ5858950.1 alpha/beta hydrolase [Flavihumibacter profundi]